MCGYFTSKWTGDKKSWNEIELMMMWHGIELSTFIMNVKKAQKYDDANHCHSIYTLYTVI